MSFKEFFINEGYAWLLLFVIGAAGCSIVLASYLIRLAVSDAISGLTKEASAALERMAEGLENGYTGKLGKPNARNASTRTSDSRGAVAPGHGRGHSVSSKEAKTWQD